MGQMGLLQGTLALSQPASKSAPPHLAEYLLHHLTIGNNTEGICVTETDQATCAWKHDGRLAGLLFRVEEERIPLFNPPTSPETHRMDPTSDVPNSVNEWEF